MNTSVFSKRRPPVGARPGALVIHDESPVPKIRLISYDSDGMKEFDVDQVGQLHEAFSDHSTTWIDIQGFGDETLIRQIAETFDLHPLLLGDLVNVPQRPKVEAYGEQLLIIVRMVSVASDGDLDLEQVSIVLAKNYVLTFQERYGDVLDPVRHRLRSGQGPIRQRGADYLAYAIADTIVDGYYPVLESIGDRLEELEDEVVRNPTSELLSRLNKMKNRLVNLRRSIWPQREAFSELARGSHPTVNDEVCLYLRDTYDHCVQSSEVVEMYREMVTGLMSIYLSSIANRTNEVMRVLTVMASIFIPLTFLAGIYGMNFEHMPELHYQWSYPVVWVVMGASASTMLGFFWRKGWIGPRG